MRELDAKELTYLKDALRAGREVVTMCFKKTVGRYFLIKLEDEDLKLSSEALNQIEDVLGEELSIVPDLNPRVLPISTVAELVPAYLWRTAAFDGRTLLGFYAWRVQYASEHRVANFLRN